MDERREAHRVVAAVLLRSSGVLLCHRRADRRWYPDRWDLPGGHVEDGETEREALVRECVEELGVTVLDAVPLPFVVSDPTISLTAMRAVAWEGEPSNVATDEHDAIGWFDVADLTMLRLADARYRGLLTQILDESGDGRRAVVD